MRAIKYAWLSLMVGAFGLYAPTMASATPITYTEEAVISGSLDGTAFTGETILISWTGDTTGVTSGSGFFANLAGPNAVSFTISNVGSGLFTGNVNVFSNQVTNVGGFTDQTASFDIIDTADAAFATYDLTTAIGPITNTALFNDFVFFGTTAGGLNISDVRDVSTFTATVADFPEPATVGLLGLGLAAWVRRRRAVGGASQVAAHPDRVKR